jgi:threonylcarbamoyladenosine tRNA methylthiotransferase MtaB
MHVFKYSKRKGTKAAVMPNQISGDIKEERSRKLIELSNQNQKNQNETYIGKEIEVLLEEKDGEYVKGHTTNYIMVYVKTDDIALENKIVKVEITRSTRRTFSWNISQVIKQHYVLGNKTVIFL